MDFEAKMKLQNRPEIDNSAGLSLGRDPRPQQVPVKKINGTIDARSERFFRKSPHIRAQSKRRL